MFESFYRVVVDCGAVELPTAFACGHWCTVGLDRDPRTCLDAQDGTKAERQPLVVGAVLKSCGHGRGRRDVLS